MDSTTDESTRTPALPYTDRGGNATSGYSRTGTSRDRALRRARSGADASLQNQVLELLRQRGTYGATSSEVTGVTGVQHQSVSSTLTGLNKSGRIAHLSESRLGSGLYVLPENVGRRALSIGKRPAEVTCPNCDHHFRPEKAGKSKAAPEPTPDYGTDLLGDPITGPNDF